MRNNESVHSDVVQVVVDACREQRATPNEAVHIALTGISGLLEGIAQIVGNPNNTVKPGNEVLMFCAQLAGTCIKDVGECIKLTCSPHNLLAAMEAAEKVLGYNIEAFLQPKLVEAAKSVAGTDPPPANDPVWTHLGHRPILH